MDEYLIADVIKSALNSDPNYFKDMSAQLIFDFYNTYNKALSHSFWQLCFENFLNNKLYVQVIGLLDLYSIRYSYSESLLRTIIIDCINNQLLLELFAVLTKKLLNKRQEEDYQGYENVFNILIEEIAKKLYFNFNLVV